MRRSRPGTTAGAAPTYSKNTGTTPDLGGLAPRPSRRPTRGPQSRAKPRVTPLVTISDWRYLLRRHLVTTPALWAGRLSLKGPCLRIDRKTAGLSRHRTTRRAPATPPWNGSYSRRQPLARRTTAVTISSAAAARTARWRGHERASQLLQRATSPRRSWSPHWRVRPTSGVPHSSQGASRRIPHRCRR